MWALTRRHDAAAAALMLLGLGWVWVNWHWPDLELPSFSNPKCPQIKDSFAEMMARRFQVRPVCCRFVMPPQKPLPVPYGLAFAVLGMVLPATACLTLLCFQPIEVRWQRRAMLHRHATVHG
eukprot:TRINITY_DN63792_c0_g1_i1.p2 TRINITY_DN63792_c0_g1~~TRINITY_DN63792_c0_g1_i1.p2  ORF type:complete len:122 (+),score=22.11 TRINITY_DN63792_c0_g1_i1:94-459(+)